MSQDLSQEDDAKMRFEVLLYSSISESAKAFKSLDHQTRTAQSNGHIKKSN